ncbi:outer dense fiber protein 2 [Grus japonensis]|uniref:Outer dense fiber protein 2 n=1 Tax=Grus japonensis TaxID=30415 RepID=A0ABC9XMB0_GRUJA
MGEPRAAARRRPRKCGGASCPWCSLPSPLSPRLRGLHGSGSASRRLPAADEDLLRRQRLRTPRGPSRYSSSINDEVTAVSAQSTPSRRAKSVRITVSNFT